MSAWLYSSQPAAHRPPPHACNRQSLHCVPLYDSLGENAIEYIINHSECVVAFVASDKFPGLIKALDKTRGVLKTVVYWGPGSPSAQKAVTDAGYALYSFQELQELGRQHP
ncbi:AMP-binding domain-containing protein, partial [Haematococcus lacustris]